VILCLWVGDYIKAEIIAMGYSRMTASRALEADFKRKQRGKPGGNKPHALVTKVLQKADTCSVCGKKRHKDESIKKWAFRLIPQTNNAPVVDFVRCPECATKLREEQEEQRAQVKQQQEAEIAEADKVPVITREEEQISEYYKNKAIAAADAEKAVISKTAVPIRPVTPQTQYGEGLEDVKDYNIKDLDKYDIQTKDNIIKYLDQHYKQQQEQQQKGGRVLLQLQPGSGSTAKSRICPNQHSSNDDQIDMSKLYIRDKQSDIGKGKARMYHPVGWYCKECKSVEMD
jgi:hypothetical protein